MNRSLLFLIPVIGLGAVIAAAPGCSSSDDPATGGQVSAVSGAPDDHCEGKTVTVDPATCHATEEADAGAEGGAGTGTGGGAGDGSGGHHHVVSYNAEGDDDDCKYHVVWSAEGGGQNADVTFTVTITNKSDGSPVTGAPLRIEAFLDDQHPAPDTDQVVKEIAPGKYTIGPIRFDAAGDWTVRFHIHGDCNDGDTSPHGHAAFFVHVP